MAAPRLPVGPLFELVAGRVITYPDSAHWVQPRATARDIALYIGVSPRTIRRWRRRGYIRAVDADTICVRLGLHPAELWPHEWRQT